MLKEVLRKRVLKLTYTATSNGKMNHIDLPDQLIFGDDRDQEVQLPALWPTLIIGLGGTGVKTLRGIKRRIRERLKPEAASLLELLGVDTEPFANTVGEEPLDVSEYAFIANYNAADILLNLDRHPEIKKWWPAHKTGEVAGMVDDGARQKRYLGRLSFYHKFDDFRQRLNPKLRNLQLFTLKEAAEEAGYQIRDTDKLNIMLVAGSGGGTGSAAVLDTALYLKSTFHNKVSITLFLCLPTVITHLITDPDQVKQVQANAYALLKEIDFIMSARRLLEVKYPGENTKLSEPPFDRVFLIEGYAQKTQTPPTDAHIYDMLAQQIFLEIGSPMNNTIWARNSNITPSLNPLTNRLKSYYSCVTAGIIIDSKLLENYAALWLLKKVVLQHFATMPGQNSPDFAAGQSLPFGLEMLNAAQRSTARMLIAKFVADSRQSFASTSTDNEAVYKTLLGQLSQQAALFFEDWMVEYGYMVAAQLIRSTAGEFKRATSEAQAEIDKLSQQRNVYASNIASLKLDEIAGKKTLGWTRRGKDINLKIEKMRNAARENRHEEEELLGVIDSANLPSARRTLKGLSDLAILTTNLATQLENEAAKLTNMLNNSSDFRNVTEDLKRLLVKVRSQNRNSRNPFNKEICDENLLLKYADSVAVKLVPTLYQSFLNKGFEGSYNPFQKQMDPVKRVNQKKLLGRIELQGQGLTFSGGDPKKLLRNLYDSILREVRGDVNNQNLLDILFNETNEVEAGIVDNRSQADRMTEDRIKYKNAYQQFDQLFQRASVYLPLRNELGFGGDGFSEMRLIGLNAPQDERFERMRNSKYSTFTPLKNGDPTRIEVIYYQQKLDLSIVSKIEDYRNFYKELSQPLNSVEDAQANPPKQSPPREFLHLAQDWDEIPNHDEKLNSHNIWKPLTHFSTTVVKTEPTQAQTESNIGDNHSSTNGHNPADFGKN